MRDFGRGMIKGVVNSDAPGVHKASLYERLRGVKVTLGFINLSFDFDSPGKWIAPRLNG